MKEVGSLSVNMRRRVLSSSETFSASSISSSSQLSASSFTSWNLLSKPRSMSQVLCLFTLITFLMCGFISSTVAIQDDFALKFPARRRRASNEAADQQGLANDAAKEKKRVDSVQQQVPVVGNAVPPKKNAAGAGALQQELQKFVDRRKEQSALDAKRKEEIDLQIKEHEQRMAIKQKQMEERERQRQERERLLNEHRKQEEQVRELRERDQKDRERRDREEQERIRDSQREKEREQHWLEDMRRKNQNKQPDEPNLQKQVQRDYVKEAAPNRQEIPVADSNNAGAGINTNDNARNNQKHVVAAANDADKNLFKEDSDRGKRGGVEAAEGIANRDKDFRDNQIADNPKPQLQENNVIRDDRNHGNEVLGTNDNDNNRNVQNQNRVDSNVQYHNNDNANNGQGAPLSNNNDNQNQNSNDILTNNNQWNVNNNNNNNNFNNDQKQNMPHQDQHQQQPQQPQIGGLNLQWDWEDFSIMFDSYGAAEMKVRRSPHPSTGEPWPMPQYYSKKDHKVYKVSRDLHFIPTGVVCDILDEALIRHLQRTLHGAVEDMYDNLQNAEGTFVEDPTLRYEKDEFLKAPLITRVEVKVKSPCEKYPSLESDESYDLVVKKKKTYIWANEIWGALRGLETFGQLVWKGTDGFLYIKETVISDYPRFPHRGLHIDTSRHFLFKEIILDIMDSMEMNKLNVFHWHIVDDQSFPYESKVYPELSRKGAFHPTYVYSLEDIAEIIEYGRMRGIRVMPEFDTPGHTYSWGLSRPELLTQCYTGSTPVKGYLGPIDPTKNSTYRFLQTLFQEVMDVFKDQYLHLGGDEVPLGCWQSNSEVMAFATELAKQPKNQQPQQSYNNNNYGWSMWSEDVKRVYEYYENRLIKILGEIGQKKKKGVKYIMWQEVMNNNLQLPNDTIIQVWMGDMADVMRATSMGYQVLYSTCWYMDHIEYGTKWPKYYNCDPVDQSYGYHIDEKKVLGGEAAFWSEYFSNENLIPLMWPRASAAAERLWSSKDVKNLDKAAVRLAEHRCRMIKRGINAGEISGPGYCLHAPPKRRMFNDSLGCKGGNCSRSHNFVQIEDIELHLSQRGGSIADCGNVFTRGNYGTFIILMLVLAMFLVLYTLSRTSSRLHRSRICKNRSVLLIFFVVLLVYFLCYTTIWMRAFEFSGSFHKTLQGDNRSGREGGNVREEGNSNGGQLNS